MEMPSVDKREYRHLEIGAMDVLLISDPETDKASAACDVYVGQLCDPLPGLAHFCEHMLFIGTSKYPSENAYDQFLSNHGGSSNAFTDLEHTCYYFDVQSDCLDGALDRFAQCFIGPLFTQAALEREVQAVDSEHNKNLQQDMWRFYQLSKSKISGSSNEKQEDGEPKPHPFASFGSGNQESLPILTIREQLLEFYQKYYRKSLSLYKLVVLGKESLDELQTMVEGYFNELASEFKVETESSLAAIERPALLQEMYSPMSNWQVPQRLHIVPVSQIHAVELQFPMRSILDLYKSKPTRYLSHLIGHEGKGSLLSLLKAKHYAQELYADDSSKSCVPWSIFTIRIELTENGLQNVHEVVQMVFSYIDLLRQTGPKEWIQHELQTVADLQFRFLSQYNPMDYTCSLAGRMQHYPPEHYLSGAYKVYDWNPDAVTECLQALTPDNALLMISSPTMASTEGESKMETEKWYGTQYESVEIDEALWNQWRTSNHSDYPDLQLPQVNDMIATEFDLLKLPDTIPKDQPQCLLKSLPIKLWYKPDNVFEMPKINLLFQFASGDANASPEAVVATHLFAELVEDQVNEFTYLASMAGLHCEVGLSQVGLELHVTGYHHKAHVLVERIVDTMMNMTEVDPEVFGRIVDKLEQQYQSFTVLQPYQHAIYGADLCLEHVKYTVEEKMTALKGITSDEVLQFAKRFWKHCQLEGLVHGNVTSQHAKEITETIWKKLQRNEESNTHASLESRVVQLAPNTSYLYRFAEFNEANTNSSMQMILQMGPMELPDNAILGLVHHLIREPAFNQLRTEEQLGYIVHTSVKTSGENIKGLLFLIQSDGFDPIHVESRVEEFLAKFRQRIVDMTPEDFQTNVDSVVSSFLEKVCTVEWFLLEGRVLLFLCRCWFAYLLTKNSLLLTCHPQNKNLGEESSRYWHVILNQTYQFTRLQQIAEHVKKITKDKVLRFYDKYVAASAPCRRKLCIQVFAKQHEDRMGAEVEKGVVLIENPTEFKRSMPLYPLAKKADFQVVEIQS
jgi:insulysin